MVPMAIENICVSTKSVWFIASNVVIEVVQSGFICSVISIEFNWTVLHKRTEADRRFACNQCPMKFFDLDHLERHKVSHNGIKSE